MVALSNFEAKDRKSHCGGGEGAQIGHQIEAGSMETIFTRAIRLLTQMRAQESLV